MTPISRIGSLVCPSATRNTVCLRLGWLTDIHLNFVSLAKREEFYLTLCDQKLDALLLGGDIGEADSVL